MNNNLREILAKYDIPINKITILSNAKIVDDKIVVKERKNDDIDKTYSYLKSRSFDYFPEPIAMFDKYELYPYIDSGYEPKEQKAMDLMYLLSLLHSKTTFYREVDIDRNKEIYENIVNDLDYLNNYYSDLITSIEKEVYMAPSSYLIARNINIIFESIYYSRNMIESWYKKIENNKNERVVNIHNNITLDHYIKSEKPYLISWNKSRIDSPIYDLLSFYKNHYLELDFDDLFNYYESSYPLKEEEKLLLFSYMSIPDKIELENDEYKMCIKINKMIDYLYKTSNLIMNYQKK
ncbi:MAG: hypothetical protein ACI310_05360 [Bacilli bacterium]